MLADCCFELQSFSEDYRAVKKFEEISFNFLNGK